MQFLQQFCMAAVGGVSSPFVLQEIAVETAKYLSESNNQQVSLVCSCKVERLLAKLGTSKQLVTRGSRAITRGSRAIDAPKLSKTLCGSINRAHLVVRYNILFVFE